MEISEIIFRVLQWYTVLGLGVLFYTPKKVSCKHRKKFILATGPIGWAAATAAYILKKADAIN